MHVNLFKINASNSVRVKIWIFCTEVTRQPQKLNFYSRFFSYFLFFSLKTACILIKRDVIHFIAKGTRTKEKKANFLLCKIKFSVYGIPKSELLHKMNVNEKVSCECFFLVQIILILPYFLLSSKLNFHINFTFQWVLMFLRYLQD